MIRVLLLFLAAGSLSAGAWGDLLQPDGTVTRLGVNTEPWGQTYIFPTEGVPTRSWLVLPPGITTEAVLVTERTRTVLSLPTVHVPGVRAAVEVPAGLLALSLRGTASGALMRTTTRPEGQAWMTRTAEDTRITLPSWNSRGSVAVALRRPLGAPWSVTVSGAAVRTFELEAGLGEWSFFPDAWGFQPRQLSVTGTDAGRFDLRVRAYGPAADLPADPETIIAWQRHNWRSPQREWFSWAGTSVLVLVSGDYAIQDQYLKRLAFFVEKTGYRGRLVSDAEVSHLHGWNAHDYAAGDLAKFFSLAAEQSFPLNRAEQELRDRLVAAGIIQPQAAGWRAGTGALVGVSAESPPSLRAVLFVHEAFHGLYYTSDEFRSGVKAAWDAMGEDARAAFRTYLAVSRYDPSDEALMANEFQAYVLQRPSSEWKSFFRDRVLGADEPREPRLSQFLEAAKSIESVVTRLYGLHSGSVSLVRASSAP